MTRVVPFIYGILGLITMSKWYIDLFDTVDHKIILLGQPFTQVPEPDIAIQTVSIDPDASYMAACSNTVSCHDSQFVARSMSMTPV